MELILPVLLNILLVIIVYFLKKKGFLGKLSPLKCQIIIGIAFGAVSSFSSFYGVDIGGVVVNVRDASPIISGLLFGPLAGLISGFIGGTYRALSVLWGAGTYTVVACTISTMMAGVITALLKKYMFEGKRPTITYAIGITVVLEVFHMLMIFITNFNDANTAFNFIRQCTLLMIVANSIAVGLSVLVISLFNKEFKIRRQKKEKGISDTFQVWLFASIVIAFIATSVFTYNLQSRMNNSIIQEQFRVSMEDTASDIREESDGRLLEILNVVKYKYENDRNIDLKSLLITSTYEIKEINIVDTNGIIIKSSDPLNIFFDMNKSDQAAEFMCLVRNNSINTFVQSYQKNGKGLYRKYAGARLSTGGFIQIGYDKNQFQEELNEFVVDVTKNRHMGASGFIAVCNEDLNLVTDENNPYYGLYISSIGITPNEEMLNKVQASQIYEAELFNQNEVGVVEDYIYVFAFVEGYCIIAALPQSEAMLMRDASIYINLFMQVLIFAVLFLLIFYLIKKIIVKNLHIVNQNLSEISGGNLNVEVDVRESEEFSSLSDDINSTVSTLKRYIAEAAARIDKELEYAKQIQLSALPTNFPNDDEIGVNACMIAAKEVGGDFYDFYKLDDNHYAFLVADVSGKGIPAAMFMMTAKTIIKDLAESGLKANQILQMANDKLCENNESGMFVTAWIGILNLDDGNLEYSCAGHNPPLVINKEGNFEYLKSRAGFVLGGMDGVSYRLNELKLNHGDRVFLYTDGVTEATNKEQQLYGEDRLLNYMNHHKDASLEKLLPSLKENIDVFVGEAPQFDDITMMVFEYRQNSKEEVARVFKAKDEELNQVLSFFEEQLEKCECPMKLITPICVAIEEVFVNIAHYAYQGKEGECKFTISFNKGTRELVMICEDKGIPFNPLTKKDPDVTLSAEKRDIGGLGIYIVKKTMDHVSYHYEDDTNILTMRKKI